MVYCSSESFTVNGDDLERGYHGCPPTLRPSGRAAYDSELASGLDLTTAMSVNTRSTVQAASRLSNPFNTDLAEARLRYGPSALRSAVEALSPERRSRGHGNEPIHFKSAFSSPLRSIHASLLDMNPSASTFTPVFGLSVCPSDASPPPELEQELGPLNVSLCNALNREREAHQKTRAILARVQQENQKYEKNNASLSASVKMLGSIVKYNMEQMDAMKKATYEDDQKVAAKALYNGKSNSADKKDSILYDLLANQRHAYESQGYSEVLSVASDNRDAAVNVGMDDLKISDQDLFNFNALSKTDFSSDAGKTDFDQSIMRHFLDTQESAGQPVPDDSVKTAESAELVLVPLSPELVRSQPLQPTSLRTQVDNMKQETIVPEANQEMHLAEKPVLHMPESFLQNKPKYRKGSETVAVSDAPSAIPVPISAPAATSGRPLAENKGDSPGKSTTTTSNPVKVTTLPKFMNLDIKWTLPYSDPVFMDDNDRLETLGPLHYGNNSKTAFWKHPVRYLPKDGAKEKNIYRTVMIDNIPEGSSYRDVLQQIRGGSLESIDMVGPVGLATSFLTARVVFNYEHAANILCGRAHDQGIYIHGQKVRVWQVLQPTYPKNAQLEEDVFEEGYTRLLLMGNVRPAALAVLHKKLARQIRAGSIVEICRAPDGVPMIEFTSVAEAGRAVRKLSLDPDFREAQWDFEIDYCEGSDLE